MNPYLILIVIAGFCGVSFEAFRLGVEHEKANEVEKKDLVAEAVDAANNASAAAIAAIKPKYTTINSEVQREVRTNTIYNDCHNTADGVRLLNQALSGGAKPASDSELPKADPAK
jgi:hypothetical protein